MNFSELRSLDPRNIGAWPLPIRVIIFLVLIALVCVAGYYLDTQNQISRLSSAQGQEKQLKDEFSAKQLKAANLEPLTEQLGEMKQSLGAMLRLLPSKTEIEGLLVDISQSGLAAGLEFELFKPEKEAKKDFYAVQPIDIRVTGEYEQFASFIEAVAALPRIVTQHDLLIAPKGDLLSMQLEARTYRYLDETELADIAEQNANSKKKKKRRRR